MLGFRCSSIILYSGRIVPGHLLVRGHMELFLLHLLLAYTELYLQRLSD